MDRRHFLGSLSALAAGMLLDPERALWLPGQRTYFDIVAPKIHGYSRVMVRASDGTVATLKLAHDFPIDLGQDFTISHAGHGDDAWTFFRGKVVGVGPALTGEPMAIEPADFECSFGGEKTRLLTEVSSITRTLSSPQRFVITDFPQLPPVVFGRRFN